MKPVDARHLAEQICSLLNVPLTGLAASSAPQPLHLMTTPPHLPINTGESAARLTPLQWYVASALVLPQPHLQAFTVLYRVVFMSFIIALGTQRASGVHVDCGSFFASRIRGGAQHGVPFVEWPCGIPGLRQFSRLWVARGLPGGGHRRLT